MTCQDCGCGKGEETFCPYAEDVHGEEVEVILCEECYDARCMEI